MEKQTVKNVDPIWTPFYRYALNLLRPSLDRELHGSTLVKAAVKCYRCVTHEMLATTSADCTARGEIYAGCTRFKRGA